MKTNPKYVVHRLAMPISAIIGLAAAIPSGLFLSDKIESDIVLPDQTGSTMEASIIAEHQAGFSKLAQMKAEIELLESQTVLTDGSTELTQMKSDFNRLAVSTYGDLYLNGSTQENGAGISETYFQELHDAFAEKIINPATIGFAKTVGAGMLDETLAATDLKTGSDVERFQTVKAVSHALSAYQSTPNEDAHITGVLGGLILLFLSLLGGVNIQNKYRKEPRHIPTNRPKSPYGKH